MTPTMEAMIGGRALPGLLTIPAAARGLVIFAHDGSGSSRFSPRNRFAAQYLFRLGFSSLLFDLLTEEEARDRRNDLDIALLGARMAEAIDWARGDERTFRSPFGLFGASTGAAAIVAAADRAAEIAAIVSRGGRPDLAGDALTRLQAPTLLIVGGEDREVLALNRAAQSRMTCEMSLTVVAGATHLFEEEGALEEALAAAGRWYGEYLRPT